MTDAATDPICVHVTSVQKQIWYHEGPEALAAARQWIAQYSLPRWALRLICYLCCRFVGSSAHVGWWSSLPFTMCRLPFPRAVNCWSLPAVRTLMARFGVHRTRDRLKHARLVLSHGDLARRAETQTLHSRLRVGHCCISGFSSHARTYARVNGVWRCTRVLYARVCPDGYVFI